MKDLTKEPPFGKLTVISYAGPAKHWQHKWLCRCECGREVEVFGSNLTRGHSTSCGCVWYGREPVNKTHGETKTKLFGVWSDIKKRCLNKNARAYQDYGGRGILVCQEWIDSFESFKNHVGPPPSEKHEIDRIDNNGNYEPSNVKWSTKKEQCNNRRSSRWITANGITRTLQEWADATGIKPGTISWRIKHGKTPEEALNATAS